MALLTLPCDIISYIGRYLESREHRACRLSAKCFKSISYDIKQHTVTFTQYNHVAKLDMMQECLRCITVVKPNINKLRLVFQDITDGSKCENLIVQRMFDICCEYVDPSVVRVYLYQCCASTEQTLMSRASNRFRVHVTRHSLYNNAVDFDHYPPDAIHSYTSEINDDNCTILSSDVISGCRRLCFVTNGLSHLDLSRVDIHKNRELFIWAKEFNFSCTHPHKVTHIFENVTDTSQIVSDLFLTSCERYPNFQQVSRICSVSVYTQTKCHNDNVFFALADVLPKTVTYKIKPDGPGVFAFIDGLMDKGLNNFCYLCDDEQSMIQSLMCRHVATKYKFTMEICHTFAAAGAQLLHTLKSCSMQTLYDKLNVSERQQWKIVVDLVGRLYGKQ